VLMRPLVARLLRSPAARQPIVGLSPPSQLAQLTIQRFSTSAESVRLPPLPVSVPPSCCSRLCRKMSSAAAVSAPSAAVQGERKYKFYRSDFAPLEAKPLHLDLYFDIIESRVVVTNHTTFVFLPAAGTESQLKLSTLRLSSRDLDISSVERITDFIPLTQSSPSSPANFAAHVASFSAPNSLQHRLDAEDDILSITLDSPVTAGQQFVIRLVTIARPTDHILEGLYYDSTPAGCPRTIISQCQQYGFQRITPCMDYMTAKAFYTTTITADKRYTNVITNGDLAPGYSTPAGVPVGHPPPKLAPADVESQAIERQTFKFHNHLTNMAPYLFFLGVGTYATFRKQLEYPDGDTFALELLAFPNLVRPGDAETAIQALHDSVMWVYLSTGPEAHLHDKERAELYALIKKREELKQAAGGAETQSALAEVRSRCRQLIGAWKKTGYKYTGAVYREIAMENSEYTNSSQAAWSVHTHTALLAAHWPAVPLSLCVSAMVEWRMLATRPSSHRVSSLHRFNPTQVTFTWKV
jgi:aminopeptidase N